VNTGGWRDLPVTAIAHRVVVLLNEVEAGLRPASQISPLLAVHLRSRMHRARPERGPVASLRRLVVMRTGDGEYQVVAVCARGGRVSATGLQLTRRDAQWQVTDVASPRSPSNR
jgi:hypothetical protein